MHIPHFTSLKPGKSSKDLFNYWCHWMLPKSMKFHEISVKFENMLHIYIDIYEPYCEALLPTTFLIFSLGSPGDHATSVAWSRRASGCGPVAGPVATAAAENDDARTRMDTGASSLSPQDFSWPRCGMNHEPTNKWMKIDEDAFYEWRLVKSITVEREKYNISKNIIKNRSQKVPKPSKPFTGKMPKQKYCSQDTPPFPSPLRVAGAACRSDSFMVQRQMRPCD